MTLPQRAKVEAAPNFLANLDDARRFFTEQDETSAPARFRQLRSRLREMVAMLTWAPASGRPARFLSGHSVQARMRAERVLALAAQAGLPELREYVVEQHVVLYAHSPTEVVLLAVKHERQLGYSVS
ncbi:type II toxin-antitoxin system RelE/ParE family toxin [Aromatoleum evansii]|uniref:Type II toxin-antitoxin system RelE/ParE family toxin n=1 Tax=Aromatoleum evansii TaxID=59406 RepID=A0ABZ1AK50_AROEV|nr:type II toxin-antitoxin system RelE/ParE family toxin [Aromatoleum evansii]